MIKSTMSRKAEMYEMIMAMENDFIENLYNEISKADISEVLIERSNKSDSTSEVMSILQGLDFQAYIEICNLNLSKLGITKAMKDFINKELSNIIPIRNTVMHPRPLGVMDYHMVKGYFEEIDSVINIFTWKNVEMIRVKIADSPETLRLPPLNVPNNENIIENLPKSVDFEETDFIGRRKEIGEIKAKLNKKNVHILSIIGDGGVGKTAIALKLLYDMLDDVNSNFEFILWSSLKTNELNNYEFKEIRDSISTVSGMYKKLDEFVGSNEYESTSKYIIDLAKEFNMLLVLDNLETINTNELKNFLDEFTEYGKVLITSRIGLGEMEHRYRLSGLCDNDVKEYTTTLLSLYGFEGLLCDEDMHNIAVNELYSNPLAIKWFIRCLYNKQEIDDILANKEEIANFCMSNVYEKLSEMAHEVLDIILLYKNITTTAELMYFMDDPINNYMNISYAINELSKTNFISDEKFRTKKELEITDFAREFLKSDYNIDKTLIDKFKSKERKLYGFYQRQLQSNSRSPYAMKEFRLKDNNDMTKVVASYYLQEAIKEADKGNIDLSFDYVDFAKKISGNYYQCYKISAYLYGTTNQQKAVSEYELAFKACDDQNEKVIISVVYAGYLLRCNDYYGALEQLKKAESLCEGEVDVYVYLEQAKIYACVNKFDSARDALEKIDFNQLAANERNIYITRNADLLKRESELFDYRDIEKKYTLLEDSYNVLLTSDQMDLGIYNYMIDILVSLAYIYYYDKSIVMILSILDSYYSYLRKIGGYRKFRDVMNAKIDELKETDRRKLKKYLTNVKMRIDSLDDGEGIVYHINHEKKFGFFRNKEFMQGIYFQIPEKIKEIEIGNIICYDKVIKTTKGPMSRIKYIKSQE